MDERTYREQAVYQFRIQADVLGYEIVRKVTPYMFVIRDVFNHSSPQIMALVLPETFDVYRYRIFKKHDFNLLVVRRHNAIVPTNVLDMQTGLKYFPGSKIDALMRENARRRNADEKLLLLSQIIVGAESGKEALETMSERMRQRYQKEADSYLTGRIGRPFQANRKTS